MLWSSLALALALASSLAPPAHAAEPKDPAETKQAGRAASSPQIQASQAEARRLSDAFVSVAEQVSPSVVQIDVTMRDESKDELLRWFGRGAGNDSPVERKVACVS